MNTTDLYIASAGQTYLPPQENTKVDTIPFQPPQKPSPPLPDLKLRPECEEKGYVLPSQKQHFLPGVTAAMLDWFWANMEKCYYLWAPGSHKRFNWIKSPAQYGMEHSVHMIAESIGKDCAVFGGSGIEIHRLPLSEFYPFTHCLEHVICEGVYNGKKELVDATVHMWEDTEGGCFHITATVQNSRVSQPPAFILKMLKENPNAKIVPNYTTEHEDYEASQWPVFLPALYKIWKDHPDPFQNVPCDLTVSLGKDGRFHYLKENGPITM